MASGTPLPKFDAAPVVETVLGVQFDPLSKFKNAHLGLSLPQLGHEWFNVSDAQPLPVQFERFDPVGEPATKALPTIDIRATPGGGLYGFSFTPTSVNLS